MRIEFGARDISIAKRGSHAPDEGRVAGRHNVGTQVEALGVAHPRELARQRVLLLFHLLALFLRQDGPAGPEDIIGRFPPHDFGPEPRTLIENIREIDVQLVRDRPAAIEVEPVDLDRGQFGV